MLAETIWKNKKSNAVRSGIEFTLSLDWVQERLQSGKCEVTGIGFDRYEGKYRVNPFSPQIDRIDPGQGYTESNCRIVCAIYNMAKMNWTDADVKRMAIALIANDHRPEKPVSTSESAEYVRKALRDYKISNVAMYFSVSRPTVYTWLETGRIPHRHAVKAARFAEENGLSKRKFIPAIWQLEGTDMTGPTQEKIKAVVKALEESEE